MAPGGRLVVGDLMVVSGLGAGRARSSGLPGRRQLFADEFPWFVDEILVALDRAGFRGLVAEQLSDLSWGWPPGCREPP
jgi:hypothetical protein